MSVAETQGLPAWLTDELWAAAQAAIRSEGDATWARAVTPRPGKASSHMDYHESWAACGKARVIRSALIVWWWHVGGDRNTWPTPEQVQRMSDALGLAP